MALATGMVEEFSEDVEGRIGIDVGRQGEGKFVDGEAVNGNGEFSWCGFARSNWHWRAGEGRCRDDGLNPAGRQCEFLQDEGMVEKLGWFSGMQRGGER